MPKTKLKQSKKQPINIYGKIVIGLSIAQVLLYIWTLYLQWDGDYYGALLPAAVFFLLGIISFIVFIVYKITQKKEPYKNNFKVEFFFLSIVFLIFIWIPLNRFVIQ